MSCHHNSDMTTFKHPLVIQIPFDLRLGTTTSLVTRYLLCICLLLCCLVVGFEDVYLMVLTALIRNSELDTSCGCRHVTAAHCSSASTRIVHISITIFYVALAYGSAPFKIVLICLCLRRVPFNLSTSLAFFMALKSRVVRQLLSIIINDIMHMI